MRIGGGVERWMIMLPLCGLVVLVTVYLGGPEQALEAAERLAYDTWDRVALLVRR
jgi:hypothetical protein